MSQVAFMYTDKKWNTVDVHIRSVFPGPVTYIHITTSIQNQSISTLSSVMRILLMELLDFSQFNGTLIL